MVRLSLAAGLAGLAGVAGFQRQAPQRPTTVLQYKKTAKEMRAKYPEGGKVPYVLTKDAPPHGVAGDVLKVNRGFANNYLAPQGLGEPASAEVIAAFEVKLAEHGAQRLGDQPEHLDQLADHDGADGSVSPGSSSCHRDDPATLRRTAWQTVSATKNRAWTNDHPLTPRPYT